MHSRRLLRPALYGAAAVLALSCTTILGVEGDYSPVPPGQGGSGPGGSGEGGSGASGSGASGTGQGGAGQGGAGQGGGADATVPCDYPNSDPAICNECALACDCSRCFNGQCVPATVARAPQGSTLKSPIFDLSYFYWHDGSCIYRSQRDGDAATASESLVCASGGVTIDEIAESEDKIIALTSSGFMQTSKSPSSPLTMLPGFEQHTDVAEMEARFGTVFWVQNVTHDVYYGTFNGGPIERIHDGNLPPRHLAVTSQGMKYWASWDVSGLVYLWSIGSPAAIDYSDDTGSVHDLTLVPLPDTGPQPNVRIFWTTQNPEGVRIYTPGAPDVDTIAGSKPSPSTIVADQSHVYWAHATGSREISRAGFNDTTAETLYVDPASKMKPGEMLLGTQCLYWVDDEFNRIVSYSRDPIAQ
ncbi:hypothetical protein [Chondromyces apiculatus]|uniref:Uncharacterized protein n=1 Tax=Chondromyces apiculatus DSM 436 TaxID=1192034 RepID=A0A017T4N3_9BACT|nr:hypothetical protein [Chondromyces apiculatus]EYF03775.1 Hypothetical protein CAP_5205 [Chondromyces apiculatus DSM 436]